MTPYQKACKNAVEVQNACNFSGVLMSFAEDAQAVRDHMHATKTYGSREFALHPVCVLYLDKLADLQGRTGYEPDSGDRYGNALRACRKVVAENARLAELAENFHLAED